MTSLVPLDTKRKVIRDIPQILSESFRIAEIPKNWVSYDLGTVGIIHRFTFYYYFTSRSKSRFRVTIDSIESSYYEVLRALDTRGRVELRGEMVKNIEKITGFSKSQIRHLTTAVSINGENYETS